jgi:hypothetical protein
MKNPGRLSTQASAQFAQHTEVKADFVVNMFKVGPLGLEEPSMSVARKERDFRALI